MVASALAGGSESEQVVAGPLAGGERASGGQPPCGRQILALFLSASGVNRAGERGRFAIMRVDNARVVPLCASAHLSLHLSLVVMILVIQ